jgi:hypothetical protein
MFHRLQKKRVGSMCCGQNPHQRSETVSDVLFRLGNVSIHLGKVGTFVDHLEVLARPSRVTDASIRACISAPDLRALGDALSGFHDVLPMNFQVSLENLKTLAISFPNSHPAAALVLRDRSKKARFALYSINRCDRSDRSRGRCRAQWRLPSFGCGYALANAGHGTRALQVGTGKRTFSTRCATPRYRRIGSRTSGAKNA